jgi:hypothetical protein
MTDDEAADPESSHIIGSLRGPVARVPGERGIKE